MNLEDQLVALANDYISGRIKLGEIDRFIHNHVDESVELDSTGRPGALLFGFVQVRIYEMDDGLPEETVRQDISEYLTQHNLVRPAEQQRATG